MKKSVSKVSAIFMVIIMAISLSITSFAATGSEDITPYATHKVATGRVLYDMQNNFLYYEYSGIWRGYSDEGHNHAKGDTVVVTRTSTSPMNLDAYGR